MYETSSRAAYHIRTLRREDLGRLEYLLNQLSTVGEVPSERVQVFFDSVAGSKTHTVFVVADSQDRIVACATLIIEPKLLHQGRCVGHIEDVVVDLTLRRQGVGRFMITHIIEYARTHDCYKVILDSSEQVAPFYEKCGMKMHELQMAKYFTND